MDGFLSRRAADPRFQNERRVTGAPGASSQWYIGNPRVNVTQHTFNDSGADTNHRMTPHKDDVPKNSRKMKRKKGGDGEFTESQKKELRNRETSDDSDSGGCWSGYESVDGKKKGEKGSCKKKSG